MNHVLHAVREMTAAQFGIPFESAEPDTSFLDLGGDSLCLLALTRKLHDRFGVRVPVRELFEPSATPRALARRLGATEPDEQAPAGLVEFSLYFFGSYDGEGGQRGYHDLIAAAEFADANGFHAVWLPERHFHPFGSLFPNPSVLAAAIATRTSRVRLHAGSVVLPLHDPIRVAEEWSVVDNLSGGRTGLCVASGWHANDFALAPENFGHQREVMFQRLEIVRRLWSGQSVPATSGDGKPIEVSLFPKPVQPLPPLFMAVLSNPDSYVQAARCGLGVLTNLMQQDASDLAENITLYRRTRAEVGLDPDEGRVVVLVHTYLGADTAQVRAEAFRPFTAYLRSSLSLFDNVMNSLGVDVDLSDTPTEDVDFLLERAYERYCRERALIGSPRDVRPVLDALVAAGADEIGCFVDFGLPGDRMLAALPELSALKDDCVGPELRPASPAQRRMWLMDRMHPGRRVHYEPKALLLDGPLDVPALRMALNRVVRRHPQLRTTFREVDDVLCQVVHGSVVLDCPLVDVHGQNVEQAVLALRDAHADVELDLAAGPLLHASIGALGPDRHLLCLTAHHIVFDSASTSVLCRDLAAFYRGASDDLPPIDPQWMFEERLGDVEFWRRELRDAPPLQLPTDRPRTGDACRRGASVSRGLDAELARQIRAFSRGSGCSAFMTLFGALGAVLGRFASQDDFVLGTAVSLRPPGTEDMVGMFVETVAVRQDLSGDPSLAELARRTRDRLSDAIDHCDVPFDVVVDAVCPDRVAGANPLFTVLVEYEEQSAVTFGDERLTTSVLDVPREQAPFDLTVYLTARQDSIGVTVEYDTDLFDRVTVLRLLEYLEDLLRGALRQPTSPLSTVGTVIDGDLDLLSALDGAVTAVESACLHELVDQQAARTPGAVALLGDNCRITYAELTAFANRLSHQLIREGVVPGDLVAVSLPRGPGLIAALLAVLKCGAAYVPVDPALPAGRRQLMVSDSRARLVVTDTRTDDDLPETAPEVAAYPDSIAYCVYTSGSAGAPKAVAVPHRGPVNLVCWQQRLHQPLTTLQWTSPGFDVSVQEIFTTLASGATLVLVDDAVRLDPSALADHLRRHGVQRLCLPVTPFAHLVDSAPKLPELREVFVAGEPLTLLPPMRRFLDTNPHLVLYNQYGPTEASIIVTSHRVDPAGPASPPIGRSIDNVVLRVVDRDSRPVPVGVPGELLIGGEAVAAGYLGDPARTDERFVVRSGQRFYRTGDLVRLDNAGVLAYQGRLDDQVKIRGYRVEPGEVRTVLSGLPEVADAAVLVEDRTAGPALVAYVVLREPVEDWVGVLRSRLSDTLPAYLVPQRWLRVDAIPLGPNGKLDRHRLTRAEAALPAGATPRTVTELALHRIWCAELELDSVPVDRTFFDVGGNSLALVRLLERMRIELGGAPPIEEFLREPTIRAVASRFEARR
ncbi:MupA/Atu3671 family FMN-dependent luciferase-like monooxygenase [Amycolatopsis sp. NPDC003676]